MKTSPSLHLQKTLGLASFAAALLTACAAGQPSTPETLATPRTPPPVAQTPHPPSDQMTLERFRNIAIGEDNLVDMIDPDSGLWMTEIYRRSGDDDTPDLERHVARKVCGDALFYTAESLKKNLREKAHLELADMMYEDEGEARSKFFACSSLSCSVTGLGSPNVNARFRFERRGKTLWLQSVAIQQRSNNPAWNKKAQSWLEAQRDNGTPCDTLSVDINRGFFSVCHTSKDRTPGLPLRSGPSWSKPHTTTLTGRSMTDGALVEDLGERSNGWWRVRHIKSGRSGWVVSVNSEKRSPDYGKPVLCPLTPP